MIRVNLWHHSFLFAHDGLGELSVGTHLVLEPLQPVLGHWDQLL